MTEPRRDLRRSSWCAAGARVAIALSLCGCVRASSDTPSDAGGPDTTGAHASPVDSGSEPSSGDADAASANADADATACQPIDVSGFQPPTSIPMAVRSLACSGFNGEGGVVESYRDACLGHAAAYPPCASFTAGDAAGAAACYECLVTPVSANGTYSGVIALLKTIAVVNYPECVQMVDPTEAGASCALAVAATAACSLYACESTCPVTDESSVAAATNCYVEASYGGCLGYFLRSNACLAQEQGDGGTPVATICFAGSTPEDKYLTFSHYLCGQD